MDTKKEKPETHIEYEKLDDLALLDVLVQHVMDVGGAEPYLIDAKLWTELARRTGRNEEDGLKDES